MAYAIPILLLSMFGLHVSGKIIFALLWRGSAQHFLRSLEHFVVNRVLFNLQVVVDPGSFFFGPIVNFSHRHCRYVVSIRNYSDVHAHFNGPVTRVRFRLMILLVQYYVKLHFLSYSIFRYSSKRIITLMDSTCQLPVFIPPRDCEYPANTFSRPQCSPFLLHLSLV